MFVHPGPVREGSKTIDFGVPGVPKSMIFGTSGIAIHGFGHLKYHFLTPFWGHFWTPFLTGPEEKGPIYRCFWVGRVKKGVQK